MILSIDFGGAVAKVLIIQDDDTFEVVEVPLGFRTRPRFKVPDALRYIIKQSCPPTAAPSGAGRRAVGTQKTLPAGRQAEAVYASGEIASVELKEMLTEPALDPIEALGRLELPLVVVGAGITYVNGRASRGVDIEEYAEDIACWLPFGVRISEIQNYFANKKLYPQTIPTTPRDIRLEQAAARVRIQSIDSKNRRLDRTISNQQLAINNDYVIATGGALSKAPTASCVVLTLLDALQPEGLFRIYLDQKQLLPALATLAAYEEEKAQKILNSKPFVFLGTTFSVPEGVSLQIDVGLAEPQELVVDLGELVVFPLDTGRVAKVMFAGRSQKGEFEAEGGPAGLVIDARGRPLELPKNESERIRVLTEWEEQVCRHPLSKR